MDAQPLLPRTRWCAILGLAATVALGLVLAFALRSPLERLTPPPTELKVVEVPDPPPPPPFIRFELWSRPVCGSKRTVDTIVIGPVELPSCIVVGEPIHGPPRDLRSRQLDAGCEVDYASLTGAALRRLLPIDADRQPIARAGRLVTGAAEVCVRGDGTVVSAALARTTGYPRLDLSLLDVARGWRFKDSPPGCGLLAIAYQL
jgi:hypothetical protein